MKLKFIKLIVQEVQEVQEDSKDIFRGHCICEDELGTWEMWGLYAETPQDAAKGAYNAFINAFNLYEYLAPRDIIGE
jgi:hypothetical protein